MSNVRVGWDIALEAHDAQELHNLAEAFPGPGVTIIQDESSYYLRDPRIDSIQDQEEAHTYANKSVWPLIAAHMRISTERPNFSPKLNAIHPRFFDGTRGSGMHYLHVHDTLHLHLAEGVEGEQLSSSWIHAALQTQDDKIYDAISRFISLEAEDYEGLFCIFEIIQEEFGSRKELRVKLEVTKGDIDDFACSANFYRHGTGHKKPPSPRLSYRECWKFLTDLLRKWIVWKHPQEPSLKVRNERIGVIICQDP